MTAAAFIALLTSLSGPLVGLALRGHGSKDLIKLSNSFSLTKPDKPIYHNPNWPSRLKPNHTLPDAVKDALSAVETRLRQVPGAYVELEFGTLGSSQKALDPTS